jgi:hypothetical protein
MAQGGRSVFGFSGADASSKAAIAFAPGSFVQLDEDRISRRTAA